MNPLIAQLSKMLGSLRACRVIELGGLSGLVTGTQIDAIASLTVVEPAQEIITKITESFYPDPLNFQIRMSPLVELAFINIDSVDVCVSTFGAVTSNNTERFFRQVKRILKPSGTFVFAVPHPLIATRAIELLPSGYSYFDTQVLDTKALALGFDAPNRLITKPLSRTLQEIRRAGMILDNLEEVSTFPATTNSAVPDFTLIKVKKH